MERDFQMKINGWIVIAAIVIAGTASRSLGSESRVAFGESHTNSDLRNQGGETKTSISHEAPPAGLQEAFSELERAIQSSKDSATAENNLQWPEIVRFQSNLWRAMALDPSSIAPVPVNEVPKDLFAAELNASLLEQLEAIKKSPLPRQWGVEAEFSQYLVTVQEIMTLRKARQFPQARAIAKRGILDKKFEPIAKKISPAPSNSLSTGAAWAAVDESMKAMKDTVQSRDSIKRDFFGSGNGGSNSFPWVFGVVFFGFILGVGATRLNPGLFQKFSNQSQSTVPSATTHSAGTQQLDYARWLKEFEEILIRLKSTQLSHERRIEDIVINSEKISQQLSGLASDARIKNEASLEYRMSSVLRTMQSQFELSQKLQGGDRAQINVMLEHCLSLCDAIESGALQTVVS